MGKTKKLGAKKTPAGKASPELRRSKRKGKNQRSPTPPPPAEEVVSLHPSHESEFSSEEEDELHARLSALRSQKERQERCRRNRLQQEVAELEAKIASYKGGSDTRKVQR